MEDSYTYLHGQFKSKEVVSGQKYDEMEYLNDELLGKMRSLTKRYQEREEEFEHKYNVLTRGLEEAKAEAKRSKDSLTADNEMLRMSVLQKDQEIKLLKSESQCLKSRIA